MPDRGTSDAGVGLFGKSTNRRAGPRAATIVALHCDALANLLCQEVSSLLHGGRRWSLVVQRVPYGWRPSRNVFQDVDVVVWLHPDMVFATTLRDSGLRVIAALGTWGGTPLAEVAFDHRAVGEKGALRLFDRRVTTFGFVSPVFCRYAKMWFDGYTDYVRKGQGTCYSRLLPCKFDDNAGILDTVLTHTPLYEWLTFLPKPAGIFCTSERIAHLVHEVASDMRLHVGVDYHLVAVQDTHPRAATAPGGFPWDTVVFPMAKAAQQLADLMDGAPRISSQRQCCLSPRVVTRRRNRGKRSVRSEVLAAIDYISANVGRLYTIDALASHVRVSRRTLERNFKQDVGKTLLNFVLERRLVTAKRLLATSNASVSEIARRVGYIARAQFHAVFRRSVGMTPADFRSASSAVPPPPHRE